MIAFVAERKLMLPPSPGLIATPTLTQTREEVKSMIAGFFVFFFFFAVVVYPTG